MEILGVLFGSYLSCCGVGRQHQECHRGSGEGYPENRYSEFKIWALDQQHLQIEFSGVYKYKTPQGPSANEGEGSGIATLRGIPPSSNPRAPKRNAASH